MEMYTTQVQVGADFDNKFTVDRLLDVDGSIRDLTIISAYTDIKMLRELCRKARRNADGRTSGPRIRIFLDRQASTYESDIKMKEVMDRLSRKLKTGNDGSGIWLVKVGPLFHAKAVVVETNTSLRYMLGSLNMTQKAFSKNEELVGLGYADVDSKAADNKIAKWISGAYCDKLKDLSQQVPFAREKQLEPDSLQSLLLSGIMFHEEKESDPFRFNIGLPEAFLKIKQPVHPLMAAELKDSISMEAIIKGAESDDGMGVRLPIPDQSESRESWKKYCLDTCYGFWCPDLLRDEAESAVEVTRKKRSPKFEGRTIAETGHLVEPGLFSIVRDNRERISACFFSILEKLDNQIAAQLPVDRDWDIKAVRIRWGRWYDRLIEKLENEQIRERIVLGVYTAPVPNVWSDPITSRVFETSWIEGLQFAWSKSTRFKKVLKTLKQRYDLETPMPDEATQDVLEHLEQKIAQTASGDNDDDERNE